MPSKDTHACINQLTLYFKRVTAVLLVLVTAVLLVVQVQVGCTLQCKLGIWSQCMNAATGLHMCTVDQAYVAAVALLPAIGQAYNAQAARGASSTDLAMADCIRKQGSSFAVSVCPYMCIVTIRLKRSTSQHLYTDVRYLIN